MKTWSSLTDNTLEAVISVIQEATQIRNTEDVGDFDNLQNRFVSGRTVKRIPSSSSDIINGDKVGDISLDTNYQYTLMQNSNIVEWRRTLLERF